MRNEIVRRLNYGLAERISGLIRANCEQVNAGSVYKVRPEIIAAIIVHESIHASTSIFEAVYSCREEPSFFKRYILNRRLTGFVPKNLLPSRHTERMARSWSFGVMQIMVTTARENGFDFQYPTCLLDLEVNIRVGVRLFAKLLKQEGGDHREAMRRWNGRKPGDYTYSGFIYKIVASEEYSRVLL